MNDSSSTEPVSEPRIERRLLDVLIRAGLILMEARAQLGIAGSALYPQLQQVNA